MKQYNTIVFIGRLQPVHNAHIEVLKQAAQLADKIIVIIGSAKQPRTYKNPFSSDERAYMLQQSLQDIIPADRLVIRHNIDTMYNDLAWTSRIQSIVSENSKDTDKIAIIGHKKDSSTFYLDMFPQWDFIDVDLIEPLHATDVRELYFKHDTNLKFIRGVVPCAVADFLEEFKNSNEFEQVVKEREFIETYKKQYASFPYPPIFVTADCCVMQSGHVLMIKRRSEPGRGLWALPGGFVDANSDKSVKDAAIRELKEETGIKVPVPVLYGSIASSKVFDAINRSARGRTITHAFNIVLPDGPLPKIKGSDDAEKAKWIAIADVKPEECFEDHWEIISNFVGS